MKPVTVFYAGMVYREADKWIMSSELPDGAYVFINNTQTWYVVRHSGGTPINLSDVPKELRTLVLLMS